MERHNSVIGKINLKSSVMAAGLLLVFFFALRFICQPKDKEEISIALASLKQEPTGPTLAIFVATNRVSRSLRYAYWVEQKTNGAWPTYLGALPSEIYHDAQAGRNFYISLPVPNGKLPWRVSICYAVTDSQFGDFRWKIAEFFYNRNMRSIGRIFHDGANGVIVTGPVMFSPLNELDTPTKASVLPAK